MSNWQLPDGPRRRRPHPPKRLTMLALIGLVAALLLTPMTSRATPAGGVTTPLPTRVERFDPDRQVCRPEAIEAAFKRHLQPWADQPPAVLDQLRRLQLDMTRATLQRCLSQGRLEPAEAMELERRLGLEPQGTSPRPAAGPSLSQP